MNYLKNKVVISTQPEETFHELRYLLRNKGVWSYNLPMMKVSETPVTEAQQELIKNIDSFDWLIFTSRNGVHFFLKKYKNITGEAFVPGLMRIAAIGDKTVTELRRNKIRPDYVCRGKGLASFAHELKDGIISQGSKVLLLLGNLSKSTLEDSLSDFAHVSRINCYHTLKPMILNQALIRRIRENNYDVIFFTSSSGFRNFMSYFKDEGQEIKIKAASISPSTSKTMRKFGIQPLFTAKHASLEGLVKALKKYFKPKKAKIKKKKIRPKKSRHIPNGTSIS